MPVSIALILGIVLALAGTIAAFVLIVPQKKREGLNKFFKWLHDFFNFKSLWIENIMKFLYIFETLACIGIGFFMLFSVEYSFFGDTYMGLFGILLIIFGPIVSRITFEFVMLAILMVKNTIEINKKLVPQEGSEAEKAAKEAAAKAEEEAARARYQAQYANPQYAQQYPQQQYAQPPYGQPQYPQPQYGQPQYPQPQYGQPQYPQPPYAQPAPAQQPQDTKAAQEKTDTAPAQPIQDTNAAQDTPDTAQDK